MTNAGRIVIPLDVADLDRAEHLVRALQPSVGMFKIGKQLFTAAGPAAVAMVRGLGAEVFLDLKWHDIPSTVAAACRAAADLDVAMLNVHASGGAAMLRAARDAIDTIASNAGTRQPKLLAVTVLTSLTAAGLRAVGVDDSPSEQVARLARLALDCGCDGLICSPLEVARLRQEHGSGPTLVVPGVRPVWAAANDQQRAATPAEAVDAGADYLVIGRPVTASDDPVAAARRVVAELEQLAGGP
jgi:orotidine-5'-phosphate decarboxylase